MALEQNMTSTADRERGGRGWMLFLFCACIECCFAQSELYYQRVCETGSKKNRGGVVSTGVFFFFFSFPNH